MSEVFVADLVLSFGAKKHQSSGTAARADKKREGYDNLHYLWAILD